jgi:integrase/recombinase XerC
MRDDIERYVRQRQVEGWAAGSTELYRHQLDALAAFLARRGCLLSAEVVPADLDAYMQHLTAVGMARSTRVQIAQTIHSFFRTLQDEGRIVSCPSRTLPVPEDGDQELPQPPLTEAEVRAIFDSLPGATVVDVRNRCLLEMLYGCGLRRAEAIALDLDDIDQGQRSLHVRDGKAAQDRLMPVMATGMAAVKDYLAIRRSLLRGPDHGALFLSARDGSRLDKTGINEWFRRLNRRRGPDARHLHPHLFRHSIAVHLLRNGSDIRYIQQFLGHGDINTTKIYLRLVPGHLADDYDAAMPEIEVGLSQVNRS